MIVTALVLAGGAAFALCLGKWIEKDGKKRQDEEREGEWTTFVEDHKRFMEELEDPPEVAGVYLDEDKLQLYIAAAQVIELGSIGGSIHTLQDVAMKIATDKGKEEISR